MKIRKKFSVIYHSKYFPLSNNFSKMFITQKEVSTELGAYLNEGH